MLRKRALASARADAILASPRVVHIPADADTCNLHNVFSPEDVVVPVHTGRGAVIYNRFRIPTQQVAGLRWPS